MFLESHAHLDMDTFEDDRDEVLARARRHGVGTCICPSTHPDTFERNLALLDRHENLFGFIGVHPHQASLWSEEHAKSLEEASRHPKMMAIGEIGLDYHYDFSPRKTQHAVFREQLRLARRLDKPIVIHLREAAEDLLRILEEEQHGPYDGVVHCFSENLSIAEKLLELGFHLSFTGNVTFKNAGDLRETVRQLPKDRVFIETDSPYMTPAPFRGKRCEPSLVPEVAKQLAELWDMTSFEVGALTTSNAIRLFRLPVKQVTPRTFALSGETLYQNVTSQSPQQGLVHSLDSWGYSLDESWYLASNPEIRDFSEGVDDTSSTVVLGGLGDPLLHFSEMRDFLGRLKDSGKQVILETTGAPTPGSPFDPQELRERVDTVKVRLSAHTAKRFNEIHSPRQNSFEEVVSFIHAAKATEGLEVCVVAREHPKVKSTAFSNFVERQLQVPLEWLPGDHLRSD